MVDYSRAKLYTIRNTVNDKLYIGSTVRTLAQRMTQHRSAAKNNYVYPLYEAMRSIGIDKFYIELLVDCPCERKEQLHAMEGSKIRGINTLVPNGYNVRIAGPPLGYNKKYNFDTMFEVKSFIAKCAQSGKVAAEHYATTLAAEM